MPDSIELEVTEPISPTIAKKSEIDAKAEEIRIKRTLPKKPGDVVSFSEMCDWLKILTPEMMERILLYVYRIEPVINRQLADPQASNSIDVIGDGFDKLSVDYFANSHGGGKYKIIVFDSGNKDLQRNGFFSANLSIPMLDCPPKLELREVEWDNNKNKGFKSWARAQKLIDENNMPVIEKKGTESTAAQNSDAMVQAMKLAMDFATKMDDKQQAQLKRQLGAEDTLGKSIGDILLEKMKQDDPNKQVATLTTLISAMKGMQPEPQKSTSDIATMMPLLVAMIQSGKDQTTLMVESMKSQQTLLVEIIKNNNSSNNNESVDDTTRLKNLLEIAKMMKGGGGVEKEKTTLEQAMELGGAVLPGILQITGQILARQNGTPVPTNAGPVPSVTQTSQAIQNAAQQPQQVVQQVPTSMTQNDKQQLIRQFAPVFIANLAKDGWEFAAWLEDGFPNGATVVATIIKDGEDDLLNTIKSVPEFWSQVESTYGEAHMKNWIHSFVNYKEEIKKMEAMDAGNG